jgi:hypothetical protein
MTYRQPDVENRHGGTGLGGWIGENLSTHGYCLSSVCGLVTATNFYIPSTLVASWDRHRHREALAT